MAEPQQTAGAGPCLMALEAAEAPAVVARQLAAIRPILEDLAARLRARPPAFVVTCARGSSGHAALYGKYLIETGLGLVTADAAPSVATLHDRRLALRGALFLALSQSGRSPDLLRQAELAAEAGAVTVALVNDVDSPLARICGHVVPLHAGVERSIAATKSYIASLAALLQLVGLWAGDRPLLAALDRLPERLDRAGALDWPPALADAGSLFVVGRGLGFAVAGEAALKLKETCRLHAEAFSAAELRHGPLALAGPELPVLLLDHGEDPAGLDALDALLRRAGSPVLRTGAELPLPPPLHPSLDPVATIRCLYGFAARLAAARGLDPDHPRHLAKVTETR